MKKLTAKWLKDNNACQAAVEQWEKEGGEQDLIKVLNRCIALKKYDWGNWLIVRNMTYKQYVSYAVYAAEQVIDIYEKKHPGDKRPREAIEAAKACIKNPSTKNKAAARATARAAEAAARAAGAAGAAGAAAWAAWKAWVAGAAWVAGEAMEEEILKYGIKLLREEL